MDIFDRLEIKQAVFLLIPPGCKLPSPLENWFFALGNTTPLPFGVSPQQGRIKRVSARNDNPSAAPRSSPASRLLAIPT